ncbi:MAG: hydantoin utilization protein B [Candidatus Entotheonella factor]|uniref:Hydantoin utilization protein B n=3 Tax=Candidatus Entotheonella TaxID=93171 RepID=W4L9J8_ENTF1|nr:MAG: hydantoin utilization protein B [Candidatus Entotheonella factor]
MPIDNVTLQIFANHCAAASESMANTLVRTAHSTFVKETEDFTTGLTTPEGQTFASPIDLGATWFVGLDYGRALKLIDHYEEGDICMTNDPYSGFVCTHSPDLHLWKPVFYDGELVCYTVGHIHNTDVGGAIPASLSRTLTEVHQEGVRVPPTKLYKAGELNQEALNIMLTNVRMPEQNWGDLKAQIAAMNTGERKVHEMIRRFGLETFRDGMYALLDYAEQQARRLIRNMPDGTYFFSDYMDEDSVDGHPCRLALTLTVQGDELVLDYSGSDPQLAASMNIPTGGDERHVLMMIGLIYTLYTIDPTILLNSGLLRSSRCILPEGSMVNPQFPAAVGMRSLSVMRVMSVTLGAFAQVAPEIMPAACGDGGPLINVRTTDNKTGRRLMANLDPITGGGGGTPFRDGTEGSGANFAFLKNTPVEINEAEVPVKILQYGLATDSGGAGRYRGGTGTTLSFQVFSPNTVVTARNRDRSRFAPWGIHGGCAGKPSAFVRNPGTDREINLGNTDVVTLEPGDTICITSSGAGGWGHPVEREPERVLADVQRGFVSSEMAAAEYGVVIRDGAIDEDATRQQRAAMSCESNGFYGFNPTRSSFETTWTRDNYDALTEILAGLPVHWRFFVKHKIFDIIDNLPATEQTGSGGEVRQAFDLVQAQYPQLATG